MRIENHPILGGPEERRTVTFTHDGAELTGLEGEPVAAALRAAGVVIHRYTKKYHAPRGIFCAIGRCTDCVMVVNGRPNVRACVTPLTDGMTVDTQYGAGGETAGGEAAK
jgi:predicted molibdopterin-dependent oxidoreductase YjgC